MRNCGTCQDDIDNSTVRDRYCIGYTMVNGIQSRIFSRGGGGS